MVVSYNSVDNQTYLMLLDCQHCEKDSTINTLVTLVLHNLQHPAAHPVHLPEVILPFSHIFYWTLNLLEFTSGHMNVNCISWLLMRVV